MCSETMGRERERNSKFLPEYQSGSFSVYFLSNIVSLLSYEFLDWAYGQVVKVFLNLSKRGILKILFIFYSHNPWENVSEMLLHAN